MKMHKKLVQLTLLVAIGSATLVGCQRENHFLTNKSYRDRVERDLKEKKEALTEGNLFAGLEADSLSAYEREEMEFLYAYMPLADIADYPTAFHLRNVRAANRARREMAWGDSVPEDLFRHFVLPVRINNEHLDDARTVFYKELKPRMKGLSIRDAILEVNHWCHEKVVYRPTDGRTSSPLNTVRTAYGRCGEESTLLVAALRAVGIPARQVYTPRWAHTDDNHAWVEAWGGDEWYFLGACEPEPVLDLGWFNAPASRGMLMNTRVFGYYEGPEEVISRSPQFTEINVTAKYAPIATLTVVVKDRDGNLVEGADVEYKLYNYAEFYTLSTKKTDDRGRCRMTTGKGDLLIWASHEGMYGVAKGAVGKDQELVVTLDKTPSEAFARSSEIVPPPENATLPEVSAEARERNNQRMAEEDSIRNRYEETMFDIERAKEFVSEYSTGDPRRDEQLAQYIVASRGNHPAITAFVQKAVAQGMSQKAADLLGVISEKDLRDIEQDVLWDSMEHTPEVANAFCPVEALLNPRIQTEQLTPYKAALRKVWTGSASPGVEELISWTKENIAVADSLNARRIEMTPMAVWKAKKADERSRDEFFVALCRTFGIPAWIDGITGNVQYQDLSAQQGGTNAPQVTASISGRIYTSPLIRPVVWEQTQTEPKETGRLRLDFKPTRYLDDPVYYTHFTLSKIVDGKAVLQNFADGTMWSSIFKKGTLVEEGDYVLVTGTRLASGTVLTNLSTFHVEKGKETIVPLVMKEDDGKVQVIGNFYSESKYLPIKGTDPVSVLSTTGRGYFVIGIIGAGQEPSNHALRDIAARKAELEAWGRPILLLFANNEQYEKFAHDTFGELPQTIVCGIDTEGIAEQIVTNMKLTHGTNLPIFILADTFNRVVFVSRGYSIGLGDRLVTTIRGL